jgi:glycerophosphoryl diester phosphodiesterase
MIPYGMATMLVFVALAVLWLTLAWRPRSLAGVTRSRPWLIGHRGVRGSLPENSLAAFEAALEAGLDGVELDVQRSADGVLVVYHDFEMPSGAAVSSLKLETLQTLDPNIPSLKSVLELAARYPGTLLNLEIKARGVRTHGLERELAQLVRATNLADRVIVSSFRPLSLLKLRLAAPELRVGLLFAPDLPWWLRSGLSAGLLHVDALHPHESQVDERLIARARRRGLLVNTWTVNDAARVRELLALGVDGIIADDPKALLEAVGRG